MVPPSLRHWLRKALFRALCPMPVLVVIALLEVAIAIALATKWWVHGAWCAAFAGTAFLGGTAILLVTGVDPTSCGCFGTWKASAGLHVMVAGAIFCLAIGVLLEHFGVRTRRAAKGTS